MAIVVFLIGFPTVSDIIPQGTNCLVKLSYLGKWSSSWHCEGSRELLRLGRDQCPGGTGAREGRHRDPPRTGSVELGERVTRASQAVKPVPSFDGIYFLLCKSEVWDMSLDKQSTWVPSPPALAHTPCQHSRSYSTDSGTASCPTLIHCPYPL